MSEQSAKNQPSVNSPYQHQNDEIDLRHLIAMLLDGRFIIGGVIALVFTLALVYVVTATPIYKANGLIQVEDNAPGVPGLSDMAEILPQKAPLPPNCM